MIHRYRWVGFAALALWLLGLILVLQPQSNSPPIIEHAPALDRSTANLPTLAPLATQTGIGH
jgi:hypothetical protein